MKIISKSFGLICFVFLITCSNSIGQPVDYTISGYFYNINSLPRTPVEDGLLEIRDSATVIATVHTDSAGFYEFHHLKLDSNKVYRLSCSYTGFLTLYHKFNKDDFDSHQEFHHDFEMNLIICSHAIYLSEYLPEKMFKKNSATPTTELKSALKKIVGTLDENPTIIIQIGGHSSYDETKGADTLLSYKRAEIVSKFLLKEVEYKERLVVKGFGTSVPVINSKDTIDLKKGMILNNENIQELNSSAAINYAEQLNRRISISILRTDFVPY